MSADGVTMAAEAEAVIQMFRVTSFRKKETENVYPSAFHTKNEVFYTIAQTKVVQSPNSSCQQVLHKISVPHMTVREQFIKYSHICCDRQTNHPSSAEKVSCSASK